MNESLEEQDLYKAKELIKAGVVQIDNPDNLAKYISQVRKNEIKENNLDLIDLLLLDRD